MPGTLGVGARVRTEFGDEGTVRFFGPTSFREGDWVGVELDRPKGKNDGTVQGERYFSCVPNHGLFARPSKLQLLPPPSHTRQGAAPSATPAWGDYKAELSPWPERQIPAGWAQAWGALAVHATWAADCRDTPLPVVVYVSSLAGDRRTAKNSRWSVDFLASKKVPHAIVDLSVNPHLRPKVLAAAGAPAPAPSQWASDDADRLPLIDVGGLRTISSGEMQDLEDHAELDALLRQAIHEFAQAHAGSKR